MVYKKGNDTLSQQHESSGFVFVCPLGSNEWKCLLNGNAFADPTEEFPAETYRRCLQEEAELTARRAIMDEPIHEAHHTDEDREDVDRAIGLSYKTKSERVAVRERSQ